MAASTASTDHQMSTVVSISMMDYDDTSGCSGFSSEGRRLASIAFDSRHSDIDATSSSSATSSDEGHGQHHATAAFDDEFNNCGVDDEQQRELRQQRVRSVANLDLDSDSIVPKLIAKTLLPSNNCHYSVHDDDDDYDYTENYLEISWKNGAPPTVKEKNWETPDDFDKIFADTESIEKRRFKSDESLSVDVAAKKLSKCVFCIATVIFLAAIIVLLLTLTVIPKIQRLRADAVPNKPSTESMTPSPSTSTVLFPTSVPVKADEGTWGPVATSSPIIATKPSLSMETSHPTAQPTSLEPTLSPTELPTPRGSLTSSPTVFDQLSRNMSILNFIRRITNSTTLDQYPTEITATSLPEHKALVWLIEVDTMAVNLSEPVTVAQRFALATIWFGLAGPSWNHQDGWLSDEDECNWFGVTECTDGVITGVSFDGNGLIGTIPASALAVLSDLETLALPSNQVSGTIPETISYLSQLSSLNLRQNILTGTIPEALGLCPLLETVILRQNKLSGRLPTTLTKLSLMETFLADDNDLTGSIPSGYGAWTNIVDFQIHSNRFEGTVPSYSTWNRIEMFSIYRNKFASTLPSNIAIDWPNLNTLFTGENELGGTLPTEYARLTQLRHIAVNSAKHEGSIPSQYSAMSNLITFVFGNNQLTGTIPSSLASWTVLDSLSGNGNAFIGSLPTAISNWTSMKVFRMADNMLSGTIPSELSRWTNLNEFNVQNNDISGVLPSSLQSLHRITYVSVGDNPLLRGSVPSTFGSWSNLRQVNLRGTSLEGSIPWCGTSNNVTVEVDCGQFVCDCCTCQ